MRPANAHPGASAAPNFKFRADPEALCEADLTRMRWEIDRLDGASLFTMEMRIARRFLELAERESLRAKHSGQFNRFAKPITFPWRAWTFGFLFGVLATCILALFAAVSTGLVDGGGLARVLIGSAIYGVLAFIVSVCVGRIFRDGHGPW